MHLKRGSKGYPLDREKAFDVQHCSYSAASDGEAAY
jgi:hypothetical protein